MLQEWLTVPEVARHLRVDPTTIRRWISLGILPAITLPHAGPRQTYRIHHTTSRRFFLKNLLKIPR